MPSFFGRMIQKCEQSAACKTSRFAQEQKHVFQHGIKIERNVAQISLTSGVRLEAHRDKTVRITTSMAGT